MIKLNEAVVQRLKELLDERKEKPYYLHKKGGIPLSTISEVLNCKYSTITLTTFFKLCRALDISTIDFLDSPLFDEISD